ncbi:MAG: type II secretion system protein [Rhodoferax sp.]|nr:type II secretion system protein [Rhodoferax sp.]
MNRHTRPPRLRSGGFSLLEVAIVLGILGLVLTLGLQSTSAYFSQERRKVSLARVAAADAALVNYVAVQGRLPCPADGSLATGVAGAGVEARAATGVCTAMATGVLPWVTLGLIETEAQDGWGTRLTYRTVSAVAVAPNLGFTSNRALDATSCDPGGAAVRVPLSFGGQTVETCAAACTLANLANCTSPLNLVTGRGLSVRDAIAPAGTALMSPAAGTGAAYVLISHGENRGGGYDASGTLQAGTPANGALEGPNANNQPVPADFIDAPFNDSDGATRFDDIVSRPTLMSLLARAQLAPRAH